MLEFLPGEDTITFVDKAASGVINLAGALPGIGSDVIFDGPGADKLTIRRDTGGTTMFSLLMVGM